MRVLGIDYGDARTGIAISDPGCLLASRLETVRETFPPKLAEKIALLAQEHGAGKIVLGNPVNMDGSEGFRSAAAKELAALLREKTGLEVELFDERLTTKAAHGFLNATNVRGKKRKAAIDTLSAEIILQNWIDRERNLGRIS